MTSPESRPSVSSGLVSLSRSVGDSRSNRCDCGNSRANSRASVDFPVWRGPSSPQIGDLRSVWRSCSKYHGRNIILVFSNQELENTRINARKRGLFMRNRSGFQAGFEFYPVNSECYSENSRKIGSRFCRPNCAWIECCMGLLMASFGRNSVPDSDRSEYR